MFIDQFEKYDFPLFGLVRLPEIKISEEERIFAGTEENISNLEFLKVIARKGFKAKVPKEKFDEYAQRANMELTLLNELGFIDYILLVWKVTSFCDREKIARDYGRGSACGSLIFYLIGATKVDPIPDELYFERFVSRARAKSKIVDGVLYIDGSLAPDVDIDTEQTKRQKVVEYLQSLYPGRICKISTYATLQGRQLIKECGAIIVEKEPEEMKLVATMIAKKYGIVQDIQEAYEGEWNESKKDWDIKPSEEFKNWCDSNYQAYEVALKLRGIIKNRGSHPSGFVVSYNPVADFLPLALTKKIKDESSDNFEKEELSSEREVAAVFAMDQISNLTIKLDLLGVRCCSVVSEVLNLAQISDENININSDPIIYNNLQNLKFPHGIFQIEAPTNLRVCQHVKPKNKMELSDVVAIARPGALSFLDTYEKNENVSIHPLIDPILCQSRGVCLYQEQVMAMFAAIGFSLEDAEQIRRCITGDTMFVSQTRGWISVLDLIKTGYHGEKFLVMDENGYKTWEEISEIWSNGKKQVVYVKTENGLETKATKDHPFLSSSGWKARMKLDDNDYLIFTGKVDFEGQDIISPALALVITGLVCEGYYTSYASVTFTAWEKDLMEKFQTAYFEAFGEPASHLRCHQEFKKVCHIKRKYAAKINEYLHYGLSDSKCLPNELMGSTRKTMLNVIAMMYNCEGSFFKNSNGYLCIEFSSASEKLVQQLQLLLLRFGITCNICDSINSKNGKTYYKLLILDQENQENFKNLFQNYLISTKRKELEEFFIPIKAFSKPNQELISKNIINKLLNHYPSASNGESGCIYTGEITPAKFKKLTNKTKNKRWINLANSDLRYSKVRANYYRDVREAEVFDFTMKNGDRPFIVANGLVIHNCIGKKKIEEVKTWKAKIYAMCEKNGFQISLADLIWKICDDSSKYQFNKSHSIAYASLSALTTYLKFKYPLFFFLSLLKQVNDEPKPLEELAKIHNEMPHFGIKLLPPDIIKSKMDFELEGQDIRFGLSSIKNISDKKIQAVINFQKEYANKFEIFQSAKDAGLDIRILASLIQSGCLDSIDTKKSRPRLTLEAQLWNILSDKEKVAAMKLGQEFEYDLLSLVTQLAPRKLVKDSRMETIKKKYAPFKEIYHMNASMRQLANYFYERTLLGYVHSCSLIDIFKDANEGMIDIESVNATEKGEYVFFCGIVSEKPFEGVSKKNGGKYIRYTIEDEKSKLTALFFDGMDYKTGQSLNRILDMKAQNHGEIPKKDSMVMCRGKKTDEAVFINEIYDQNFRIYTRFIDLPKEKTNDLFNTVPANL